MDDMNLDYKQMFETLQELTAKKAEQEQLYFDLLCKVKSTNCYSVKINEVLPSLPMADQIKVLESIAYYQSVCKSLVEKHSLFNETEC